MPADVTIRRERPDQPEVVAPVDALDTYLLSLYEREANGMLDVAALLVSEISFFVARIDSRAVGTGAVRRWPAEGATGSLACGEIKRMYLDPAGRGRGLFMARSLSSEARDATG